MLKFLKQLFCRHAWFYKSHIDNKVGVFMPCECKKCGKHKVFAYYA